ncbi:ribbon-helix-helix domain-containing protein [Hyphomicrobium sp. CS1GBMeth3]|uniref:ribbon-helix-helix domain-containing protein n=1 Tax=Hyphomicrobium sp. CS1GBMeth3 TaxID=1892845 RepID=UPI00093110A4|nr:ribbon-helix-helix domain-containing protein [Hyphomicrobium sp. CS1GBMeth3]
MTFASARPVKRSFSIRGHRTSISLEEPFWEALKEAAARERIPLAALIARIDEQRGGAGLSSAVRVWILEYARAAGAIASYDGGNRD